MKIQCVCLLQTVLEEWLLNCELGTPFVPQPLKHMQMYGRKWKDNSSKDLGNS